MDRNRPLAHLVAVGHNPLAMDDRPRQLAHLEYLGDATQFSTQIHALIPRCILLENFSPAEVRLLAHFMDVYRRGHPKRFAVRHDAQHLKPHTIYLPDFGSDARNEQLHAIVSDFVRQIVRVMKEPEKKARPK